MSSLLTIILLTGNVMKYTGKEINKKESLKKHSSHLKNGGVVFATSDGNAFVGANAKGMAYSHAANYRPSLTVYPLNEEIVEETVETVTETKPKPKAKAKKKK
jgi:hypothetical protein